MPPRRWSEQVDGIYWLPRLIDKARAASAGTLGEYLYGQSPTDRGLLRVLGLRHRAFLELVTAAESDDAVLAALEARNTGCLERARAWSAPLPREHKLFFWLIDVDDGYRSAGWLCSPIRVAANGISRAAKRLWPRPL